MTKKKTLVKLNSVIILFIVLPLFYGFTINTQKVGKKKEAVIGNNNDTIYSTVTGGQWTQDSAWKGGIIPTQKDPVVLQGPVKIDYNSFSENRFECKSLFVKKGAVVQCKDDGPDDSLVLFIYGDLTNYGSIISQSENYSKKLSGFTLTIKGNIENNGLINEQVHLILSNKNTQTITSANEIYANQIDVKNGQNIRAGSNLKFYGTFFQFNNGTFEINPKNTVTFFEIAGGTSARVENSHLKGGGTIIGDDIFYFGDSCSVENLSLKGTIQVKNNFIIKDKVYLFGTLQQKADNNRPVSIQVQDNFVNEGNVKDNPSDSGYLTTIVYKDITNIGNWNNSWVILDGQNDQKFTNKGRLTSNFQMNANVPHAQTFQWFKNGIPIYGATEKSYKYFTSDKATNDSLYGEYYCKTDAGNSRKISISNLKRGLLMQENFDEENFPPTGWTRIIKDTDYTWSRGNPSFTFNKIDSTNVCSAICNWDIVGQNEWLISPKLWLPAKDIVLEFYIGADLYWKYDATVKLLITENEGITWHELWDLRDVISISQRDWYWKNITIDLSTYANNDSVILAWQYVGNDGQIIAIDNIRIMENITGIPSVKSMKQDYLLQNYPNPFRTETTIPFKLAHSADVKLIIYNTRGQKVAEPFTGHLKAGKHRIYFNAGGLKPGIYYYQLIKNGISASRQMIVY